MLALTETEFVVLPSYHWRAQYHFLSYRHQNEQKESYVSKHFEILFAGEVFCDCPPSGLSISAATYWLDAENMWRKDPRTSNLSKT